MIFNKILLIDIKAMIRYHYQEQKYKKWKEKKKKIDY